MGPDRKKRFEKSRNTDGLNLIQTAFVKSFLERPIGTKDGFMVKLSRVYADQLSLFTTITGASLIVKPSGDDVLVIVRV